MADWRECRLGDLGEVVGGGTPPRERAEYWNGSIPWLTPGELTGHSDKYVSETQDCVSELGLAASGARLLSEGSLLVTSRASIGSCALAGRPMATNQGFKNVTPGTEVDPSFLFYLGRTLGKEMTRRASGTTFLEISGREFQRIRVRLPPLQEQRRIAEILDTIDEAIQATERVIAKHEQVRARLAKDLLAGLSDRVPSDKQNPAGEGLPSAASTTLAGSAWREIPLEDCGHWLSGGTPDTGNSNYWEGEIPWITASSLKCRYLSTSIRRLTPAGVRAGSRIVPRETILLVVRGMSLKNEFRVGMAVRPLAFGQDCKALVPTDSVDSKYLLFALEGAEDCVLRMVDEASHGTGRLQMSLLGSLKVRVPPLEDQRRITEIIDTIDEVIHANERQLGKLRTLRSGLAADLLSGCVRTVAA